MDYQHIQSLSANKSKVCFNTTSLDLETYYHAHRRDLPDPVDDLIYDILQDRTTRKVLSQSSNLHLTGTKALVLALHFLPALQRLGLPYGKIGDLGVKTLAGAARLEAVDVCGTRVE